MKMLVVGDVMLDHYIQGTVERQSPEADVPILIKTHEWYSLGGAANTALNIRKLGAEVDVVGIGGKRSIPKQTIEYMLDLEGINAKLMDSGRLPVKTRFITKDHKHLLRVDDELSREVDLFHLCVSAKYDLIVVSDYAKGSITMSLMDKLKNLHVPIIVDPKPQNTHMYRDVYMICPNHKEWTDMHPNFDEIDCHVIVTRGEHGIKVIYNGTHTDISPNPVNAIDVCGAGDTVTAVMAVCTVMGKSVLQSAHIALKCAEWVITQPGTVPVTKEVFKRSLT